jgi:uncharacterized membrane protein YphA (DoxX/SURF4 family)
MSISGRIARPLLATVFIAEGLDSVMRPARKVSQAEAVTLPVARRISALPDDTETLIRINGVVQVGAGLLLAAGRFRRLAAVALIGSVIPTTFAGHRFWEETDDTTRRQQRIDLYKNLGLLGGLILAATDTEGAPSLSWRARRGARRMATAVSLARGSNGTEHLRTAPARTARRSGRRARRLARATVAGLEVVVPVVGGGGDLAGTLRTLAHDHVPAMERTG